MNRVWNDLLFIIVGSVLFVLLLIVLLINDPKEDMDKEDMLRDVIVVDAFWGTPVGDEEDRGDDVDLWVMGPADVRPVGYSNKTGTQFALLRDILGKHMTLAPVNQEQAGAGFIVPGRYTVNVHMYRHLSRSPTPVQIVVTVDGQSVYTNIVSLVFKGQETTVVNFDLDVQGVISNVGHAPRPLRDLRSSN